MLSAWLILALFGEVARASSMPSPSGQPVARAVPLLSWEEFKEDVRRFGPRDLLTSDRYLGQTAIWAGALALLVLVDDEIRSVALRNDSPGRDRLQGKIAGLGGIGAVGLTATSLWAAGTLADDARLARVGNRMLTALILNEAAIGASKGVFSREWPRNGRAGEWFRYRVEGGHAFPSGHTARAFVVATVLSQEYGSRVGAVAYPAAALVGLSLIGRDSHWASDVLGGALLGSFIGRTVRFGNRDRNPRFGHRDQNLPDQNLLPRGIEVSMEPLIVATPPGIGVAFRISL